MPRKSVKHRRYTERDYRAAVAAFLVTGSVQKVAKELDCPVQTVKSWRRSAEWWDRYADDIAEQIDKELVARMRGATLKAYKELDDRLDNGDERLTKDGESVRVKVAAKDLSVIANTANDRVRLAEGKATKITETRDLAAIAQQFESLAAKYAGKIREMGGDRPIIEGEVVKVAMPGDKP